MARSIVLSRSVPATTVVGQPMVTRKQRGLVLSARKDDVGRAIAAVCLSLVMGISAKPALAADCPDFHTVSKGEAKGLQWCDVKVGDGDSPVPKAFIKAYVLTRVRFIRCGKISSLVICVWYPTSTGTIPVHWTRRWPAVCSTARMIAASLLDSWSGPTRSSVDGILAFWAMGTSCHR